MEIGAKPPVPTATPTAEPVRRVEPVVAPAPVDGSAGTRPDPDDRQPAQLHDVVDRDIQIDPETRAVVFRAIDARGDVVMQLPDQAIMRMRAYALELRANEAKNSGMIVSQIV